MSQVGSIEIEFKAKTDQVQGEVDKLNTKITTNAKNWQSAGQHGVTSVQAISGALRGLDNPMGANLRALERFIAQSKLLSTVAQTMFPLVGAAAAVAMFVRLGTEIKKVIDHANGLADALRTGFSSMAASSRLANDELALTNRKIQDQIDKLSGKSETV